MEIRFFNNFLSDLPGPLSVYADLENNTIFLPQVFSVSRAGGASPSPRGRPWDRIEGKNPFDFKVK